MNASKEAARKAIEDLWKAANLVDYCEAGLRDGIKRCLLRIENFVEAAERKLPTEAAFERDRKRRDIVKGLHT